MDQSCTRQSVLVIGSGPVGLINARTLADDGFDVTVVTKDSNVGGTWRNTYPNLTTNSPWGTFTFTGLDMARPSNNDGKVIPALTILRYLEDFSRYFLDGRVTFRFSTEVIQLYPLDSGWSATFSPIDSVIDSEKKEEHYDMIVIATGTLGQPHIPKSLSSSNKVVLHSSQLSDSILFNRLTSAVSKSRENPSGKGDRNTIVVVGAGKSGMDVASILASEGYKVVLAANRFKWFAPAVLPGFMAAQKVSIMMGPSRMMDSWAEWFYHCTWVGSRWVSQFWIEVKGYWSSLYIPPLSSPTSDPFLDLPRFGGGLNDKPSDFLSLVKAGRIVVISGVVPQSVDGEGIVLKTSTDEDHVACGAIVAATGFKGGYPFLSTSIQSTLGLDRVPPSKGWEQRVQLMRSKWRSVVWEGEEESVTMPLIFRGIVPIGRWQQRDFVVAGGTAPLYCPAITHEVESHWISSFFARDPMLNFPLDGKDVHDECNLDNDFLRARFPAVDPYRSYPSATYVVGFNDLAHVRQLLRDMSLDPWRQMVSVQWFKPWTWWDWLNAPLDVSHFETIGRERRTRASVSSYT